MSNMMIAMMTSSGTPGMVPPLTPWGTGNPTPTVLQMLQYAITSELSGGKNLHKWLLDRPPPD